MEQIFTQQLRMQYRLRSRTRQSNAISYTMLIAKQMIKYWVHSSDKLYGRPSVNRIMSNQPE